MLTWPGADGPDQAAAQGDLEVATKALNEDLNALGGLHMDCMTKAQDFEAESTSHGEELKVPAMAKKAVVDNDDDDDDMAAPDAAVHKSSSVDIRETAPLHQELGQEAECVSFGPPCLSHRVGHEVEPWRRCLCQDRGHER